jgi:hypothetical protein
MDSMEPVFQKKIEINILNLNARASPRLKKLI